MTNKPRAEFEIGIALADYLPEGVTMTARKNRQEFVEALLADYWAPAKLAQEELAAMGLADKAEIVSITFNEFCSTNPHHGYGYFQVVITSEVLSSGEMQAQVNDYMAYDPAYPNCE